MDKRALAYEYMRKCGEMIGPIYYAYAKWTEEKIKHEQVFASMRGGCPILHTGKVCAEHGLADTGNLQELWVNRNISHLAQYDNNVKEYLDKTLGNKPFTMLDNGYSGTITTRLNKAGYTNMQTLLVASKETFLNSQNGDERDAYIVGGEGLSTFRGIVAEQIPSKYLEYNSLNNIGRENKIGKRKCDTFYDGMTEGILMSAKYQKKPDKQQTLELLSILQQFNREILIAMDFYKNSTGIDDKFFNEQCYQKVKNLYR